ncbi:MAG: Uma2 family endonuclease [Myxococcales bacterium]|nr:Uma2 family endonuclease [Myxococcales bacterium]
MRAPIHRHTWIEYLALEEMSTVKHEFFDGEIYAMAGGSSPHSALKVAVVSELRTQLRGKACRVYDSDLRIRVMATGLGTYPDASVVCGELRYDPEPLRKQISAVNPSVLVEVLSDSTEAYDRGAKLDNYKRLPSLEEYVLVSHREALVEVFRRGAGDEWQRSEARSKSCIALESIGCEIDVDRLYEGIDLDAP